MEEAGNELSFMVVGAYGKVLHKSFGAPIRLRDGHRVVASVRRRRRGLYRVVVWTPTASPWTRF